MSSKHKNKDVARKVARILLDIGIVHFRFDPPFTFTTGIKSPIYLDNRILMSYPKERRQIVNFYCNLAKEKTDMSKITCVSATAMGAIPVGAWIAEKLNVPLVYVRARSKAHGKENKLEGHFKKGYRALIIEDHISTAKSVMNNADTIRALGGKVSHCIGLTTYETLIAKENFTQNKIKTYTLTTGRTIVEEAVKKKMLSEKEAEEVNEWFKNPVQWAEDRGYNDAD